MLDKLKEIFTATPFWELALIFFARILEVSLGTLRVIFVNKGHRRQAFILGFIEVTIWIFVASRVISGIAEEPLKAVIYSLGFASGVYVGSIIEERLAVGKVVIQIITGVDKGKEIAETLRHHGIGVTTFSGQGKDAEKTILMVFANRRNKKSIIDTVSEVDPHAMVVSNEVATLKGGYLSNWRRLIK
ncbi:MAG TPA: DUF2179 domain-containing protein [Acholeplasmataceae bacterium]|jgi:uncharacterized protein YebE (UPF0316 family)|nr:DUF2179 domain-containing protein [Acholeplasmataceae bacterium]